MAKSIWKRGELITRFEKKKLRSLMPHPNRGREHYKWRANNARMSENTALVEAIFGGEGTLCK